MHRNSRNETTTISIGNATISLARVAVPGTDIEATTLVGQMLLPSDAQGGTSRRVVAIGTPVERAGVEVGPVPEIRYLIVDPTATTTRRRARGRRRHASQRRVR